MTTGCTPEMKNAICDALARGESLRTICKWYGMPTKATVNRWLKDDEEFQVQYAEAHEQQADFYAEQIIDIADNGADSVVMVGNAPLMIDGKLVKTKSNVSVQHARLRIDSRKWIASKLKPKKYGDKVQTDITSGGKPIKNEYHIHPVTTDKNGKD